jgi:hypothetical protein
MPLAPRLESPCACLGIYRHRSIRASRNQLSSPMADYQSPYFSSPYPTQNSALEETQSASSNPTCLLHTHLERCSRSQCYQAWVRTVQLNLGWSFPIKFQDESLIKLLEPVQKTPTIHARTIQGLELQRQEVTEGAGIVTALLSSPVFAGSVEANGGGRCSLSEGQYPIPEDIEETQDRPAVLDVQEQYHALVGFNSTGLCAANSSSVAFRILLCPGQ